MTESSKTPDRVRVTPVQTLKDHVTTLDAAMLVAVTAAEVGAVHKLRTGTRRVEAQMLLLELLGSGSTPTNIPEHRKQSAAVNRRLRKVRRAAGIVRDLDVQTQAIWYDAPAKSAVHEGSPGASMRRQAKQLRKHLKAQREGEAAKLIGVLKLEQEKLAAALRALEIALKPSSQPTVSSARLGRCIQQCFSEEARQILHLKPAIASDALRLAVENLTENQLHTLRKTAKLCRYMAEGAPDESRLRKAAGLFEAVQEVGGKWHDWLLLARLSKGFHGPKADLTRRYTKHRDAALAEYHLKLAELLPVLARPQTRTSTPHS